jgi:hypothetical protein
LRLAKRILLCHILAMTTHADLIHILGIDAIAAATGRPKGTVRSWMERDSIPPDYWRAIMGIKTAKAIQVNEKTLLNGVPQKGK